MHSDDFVSHNIFRPGTPRNLFSEERQPFT